VLCDLGRPPASPFRRSIVLDLRRRLRFSLVGLLVLIGLHVAAMMALEGLTFGEGVWLTFTTTITTTGYGDFSAKTAAGRSATIVLIYLSGIFLLTQAGSAFFELRTLRRERMRRGEWRWNLQDHIVFINAPEAEPGDYLRRLMDQLQRSHAGFSRVPALVLTENFPDGLRRAWRTIHRSPTSAAASTIRPPSTPRRSTRPPSSWSSRSARATGSPTAIPST
jgi:voltage-gated potassium channel